MPVRALARVNLAAIERNCERLRRELRAPAEGDPVLGLCAVVKANGYGHGAAASAREVEVAVGAGADVVAWREAFVGELARAVQGAPVGEPTRVHVKLDTGMGRLGTRDPDEALRVAEAVAATPGLDLAGAMTHFATADEPGDAFFGEQLSCFVPWAQRMRERYPGVVVHAANSAATLRDRAAHFDLVRCGG